MLAEERRRQILKAIAERGSVAVKELARLFSVSEMTIHRDLNRLAEDGLIEKTFGGALALRESKRETPDDKAEPAQAAPAQGEATCSLCGKEPLGNTRMLILHENDNRLSACCPHCGLILLRRRTRENPHTLATDFISSRTIDATQAFYVLGAETTPCCSPSILTFGRRDDATRFATGFGGRVVDFSIASIGLGDEPTCDH